MSSSGYNQMEYIGKSKKFKNVYILKSRKNETLIYKGAIVINGKLKQKLDFKTEREAALFVDKALISFNKEPINILKRKQ